jgi:NADH-quinone oxidoreductase subunit M
LRFFQGMMEGHLQNVGHVGGLLRKNILSDIQSNEFLILLPLLALIFYIGLQPAPLTYLLHDSVKSVLTTMQSLGLK